MNPKTHCVKVCFDDVEWNRFLSMYEESNIYAKVFFRKAHFFGKKFKVLKMDKMLLCYYSKAVRLSCPVPCHRYELQPSHEGVAHPFFRKEDDGIALQVEEMHHRPYKGEPGSRGIFKDDASQVRAKTGIKFCLFNGY